ncbi:hypothetical protein ASPACDRAFT_19809 [Aspergillus aculeatus ATCC 16872]|uniref:Uncharacterized protein n=1 Tax=Aspergillus aculeatus (strain ATCC 16872 / CBS 172.66 / WB 5094) TaxID=690307 RepID=A0A1L9X738_ASPA1|nr:uncharacterized protein ASPACDRAFT_19809 [Aspergillus aculeatus ATCC 16872]OJK04283.1 hypothetical protein ASPACDRAFT_19809 [Aspergillus aculeatus ATCC 16872]
MAAQEAVFAVSAQATQLGNRISVHMLDYLSTVQDLPDGFRELSQTFLDTCRALWAIDAGLTDSTAANRPLPEVIVEEVAKKFVAAYRDFQHLDKLVTKLIQYEHRGALGRLQRGWHRPSHELGRIRESLQKTTETLQISVLAFHWTLGEQPLVAETVGIGYAGLAAALDRMAKGRSVMGINKAKSLERVATQMTSVPSSPVPSVPPKEPLVQPATGINSPPQSNPDDTLSSVLSLDSLLLSNHHDRDLPPSPPLEPLPRLPRPDSPPLRTSSRESRAETLMAPEGDTYGEILTQTRAYNSSPRPPHRTPSRTSAASATQLRSALASAVRGRNHKLLEQLLDSGVSPNLGEQIHPLNEAVHQRDFEGMRLLLLFGANPNAPDREGKTPLLVAVEESFVDGATLLLKYRADANYAPESGLDSPLSRAIANGKISMVQQLLAHGGNPDNATPDGSTALIELIHHRAPPQLVSLLLEAGCDPNRKGRQGKTALNEAVQSEQVNMVTALLEHGANPNLPGPEHVLWLAIYRPACLRVLLAGGADIKKTPGLMEQATSINNIEAVRILLQVGVDPNAKKDGIYTPLCSAIRDDRSDIVSLLLEHAANVNDRNAQGHTALTTAIRENRSEMLSCLLAHGADPNQRGQDWPVCMAVRSPALLQRLLPMVPDLSAHKGVMEMAVLANQLESIKLLLAAGASVEYKNGGVFSPLTTALRERYVDIVRFLLEEGGADPNAPGEHLPLVKAVRRVINGDYSMVELLLEKGADPNKTYRDWNAIMQAIEYRDLHLLHLLVQKGGGADLTQHDDAGRTVLEMADASGWSEATQFLLDHARP